MNIEALREQFDELGVDPSTEVLEKCKCSAFHLQFHKIIYFQIGLEIGEKNDVDDAVEFVEKWMAFSISNLNGADPTVQYLTEMENREFNKAQKNQTRKRPAAEKSSNLKVYKQGGNDIDDEVDDEDNALLGSYVCITPKVSASS